MLVNVFLSVILSGCLLLMSVVFFVGKITSYLICCFPLKLCLLGFQNLVCPPDCLFVGLLICQ